MTTDCPACAGIDDQSHGYIWRQLCDRHLTSWIRYGHVGSVPACAD